MYSDTLFESNLIWRYLRINCVSYTRSFQNKSKF